MKQLSFAAFAIAATILQAGAAAHSANDTTLNAVVKTDTVTYQQFYDELSPYGRWVDYPGYGYAWSPAIADFQPYYTNGYWINTDMGWSWNSNYAWGWAPFHYGRWFYETGYGWLWTPGYEWAPAWVSWRSSPEFYGWAPLAPGMRLGVALSLPLEHWTFVNNRYLLAHDLRPYRVAEAKAEDVFRASVVINKIRYTSGHTAFAFGPPRKEVEGITGTHLGVAKIHGVGYSAYAPFAEGDRELKVYKPPVREQMQNEAMRPKEPMPYNQLPHDNGRRGTWSMPEAFPPAHGFKGHRR